MNVRELEKDPKLLQMWNDPHYVGLDENGYARKDNFWGGFSFFPSVNRMALWRKLKGGYANLTHNISYGTGAGFAEKLIL